MATADKKLGDFFSSKKKKKVKPTNLNAQKEEEIEKPKPVEKKDGEWDEAETKEPVPKAELGNLAKEEEDSKPRTLKPAWSAVKAAAPSTTSGSRLADMKKYPSLAISASGMPVGTIVQEEQYEKSGKKNVFAELEEPDSDDDKPARQQGLSKKRGEIDMTVTTPDDAPLDKETLQRKEAKHKKKEEKNEKRLEIKAARIDASPSDAASDREILGDCLIPMDGEAARKKYEGRRKLPVAELPDSEVKEEKIQRKEEKIQRKKLKMHKAAVEVDTKKELLYAKDAW